MRQTINVGEVEVPLRVSGATPEIYAEHFGRELMKDFATLVDSVNNGEKVEDGALLIVKRMMYVMARQANKSITLGFIDWLDQFEEFPVEEFAASVVKLFASSLQTKAERKNV